MPVNQSACFLSTSQRGFTGNLLAKPLGRGCRTAHTRCTVRPSAQRKQLPIFPLDIVAFPASAYSLHIFEARFRVLFNTLLKGADGLEEGLIQDDSPFAGSRRFGVCWSHNEDSMAGIGTILEIQNHERLDDGRLDIESQGVERFRVVRICEEEPLVICEVEVIEEDDDTLPEVVAAADEVRELYRTLIQLYLSKGSIKVPAEESELLELRTLGPRDFSFWVASTFKEIPQKQQVLLQENSTLRRLQADKVVVEGGLNYFRARLAIESALSSSEPSSESPPPSSPGPD